MKKSSPNFHNPADFDWVQILKDSYPAIKKEWNRFPKFFRTPRKYYHHGKTLEKDNSKWEVVVLMIGDKPRWVMRLFFPVTYSLIQKLPIFENLAFSIFYPGSETVKHTGWSDKIVRVHLGIDMNDKAGLNCSGEEKKLKNGEVLIFEDCQEHFAYNHGDKERTVLVFDVLKSDIGITK